MANMFNNGGFYWWCGVVEDRDDPLFLGRVRVRIVGYHTADTTILPTEDLPWAYPMMPVTSASMSGIGEAPVGLVAGSWVIGFFRDGDDNQEPVIMGSLGGIPQSEYYNNLKPTQGFVDRTKTYPVPELMDEPDTNRLARHQGTTIVDLKNAIRSINIPLPLSLGSWNEPFSAYNARYPFNRVKQTESGHVEEFDDTPDNERIHLYHRKGTFTEIDKNGTRATRIVGDDYEIFERNGFVYIKGKANVTVEGSINIYAKNNVNLQVDGDLNTDVHKDYNLNVAGKMNIAVGDDISIKTNTTFRIISNIAITLQTKFFSAIGSVIATLKGTASLYSQI